MVEIAFNAREKVISMADMFIGLVVLDQRRQRFKGIIELSPEAPRVCGHP